MIITLLVLGSIGFFTFGFFLLNKKREVDTDLSKEQALEKRLNKKNYSLGFSTIQKKYLDSMIVLNKLNSNQITQRDLDSKRNDIKKSNDNLRSLTDKLSALMLVMRPYVEKEEALIKARLAKEEKERRLREEARREQQRKDDESSALLAASLASSSSYSSSSSSDYSSSISDSSWSGGGGDSSGGGSSDSF